MKDEQELEYCLYCTPPRFHPKGEHESQIGYSMDLTSSNPQSSERPASYYSSRVETKVGPEVESLKEEMSDEDKSEY